MSQAAHPRQAGFSIGELPDKAMTALSVEHFAGGLAPRGWSIRSGGQRRAHLLVLESRNGAAALRGTRVTFASPALLWLPGDIEGTLEVEAGARGYFAGVSEDLLTRIVAGSAEALHIRRTIDRFALISGRDIDPAFTSIVSSCATLVQELRVPGRGASTMLASHVLLLCLQLWRSATSDEGVHGAVQRGDGPRLVGNFLQLVELHYRDGWPIARYAAALGVTDDRLHAHCKREKGYSPRAIIHQRLTHEACTRLQQLDLPVEQIGYGLGFRDPAYFNRFFRKYQGISPGAYRRQIRLEQARQSPTYAAWP